jgi:hypothetical protein
MNSPFVLGVGGQLTLRMGFTSPEPIRGVLFGSAASWPRVVTILVSLAQ